MAQVFVDADPHTIDEDLRHCPDAMRSLEGIGLGVSDQEAVLGTVAVTTDEANEGLADPGGQRWLHPTGRWATAVRMAGRSGMCGDS